MLRQAREHGRVGMGIGPSRTRHTAVPIGHCHGPCLDADDALGLARLRSTRSVSKVQPILLHSRAVESHTDVRMALGVGWGGLKPLVARSMRSRFDQQSIPQVSCGEIYIMELYYIKGDCV